MNINIADLIEKLQALGVKVPTPTSSGGTPGGSDTQLQYNNAGAFGGMAGSSWDGTTLTLPKFAASGAVALSPANAAVVLSPTGTGVVTINPATTGGMDNVTIGVTTARAGTFLALTATGAVALSPASANVVLSPTGTGVVTINPATAGTMNNVAIGATTARAGTFLGIVGTGLTVSTLTSGRVPFLSTGGLFTDAANFTYSGTALGVPNINLAATGQILGTGSSTIDFGFSATNLLRWQATNQLDVYMTGGLGVSGLSHEFTATTYRGGADGTNSIGTSSVRFSQGFFGSGSAITVNAPMFDGAQIWNNAAVTFTGFKLNIINTASAAASLLFDFQLAGVSVLNLTKGSQLILPGSGGVAGTNSIPAIAIAAANNGFYSSNAANVIITAAGVAMANFTGAAGYPAIIPQTGVDLGADLGYTSGFWRNTYTGTLITKSAAPTVAAGQIGFGGTVAATASAGSGGAAPALVEGYVIINVAGTARKIAYYAT